MNTDRQMPESFKNTIVYITKILGVIPIICVLVWFVYLQINGKTLSKHFFRTEVSSVVIESTSYYGRSEEFSLKNGMKIYFMPPISDKIMIGDSVSKGSNTYNYKVYRKNNKGEYCFFTEYDYKQIY